MLLFFWHSKDMRRSAGESTCYSSAVVGMCLLPWSATWSVFLFCSFEKKIYERWVAGVDEACSFNLAQPLIVRNEETNFLAVNFDPQVTFELVTSCAHSLLSSTNASPIPPSPALYLWRIVDLRMLIFNCFFIVLYISLDLCSLTGGRVRCYVFKILTK